MNEAAKRYFDEVALQLRKRGFETLAPEDGRLPVNWRGALLCHVTADGGLRYKANSPADSTADQMRNQVCGIVRAATEYMAKMETAPRLKARGLEGDYRVLAEFNSVVLAGHPTRYGVQFVTWEWVQDHTSLWQGHYTESYTAAKEDFATRSGLVEKERQFSDQQLAVIFDAVQHMMVLELTSNPEQDKLLKQIMAQIETSLPEVIDLANALTEDPKMHQLEQMDSIT